MKDIFKYHWRAIAWILLIFIACLLPGKSIPEVSFFARVPHFDKIVHFGMYFIFTLFLLAGFTRKYSKTSIKAYFISFIIALCCGLLIEMLQSCVGRSCDLRDAIANTAGAITAIIFYQPVKWMLRNIL